MFVCIQSTPSVRPSTRPTAIKMATHMGPRVRAGSLSRFLGASISLAETCPLQAGEPTSSCPLLSGLGLPQDPAMQPRFTPTIHKVRYALGGGHHCVSVSSFRPLLLPLLATRPLPAICFPPMPKIKRFILPRPILQNGGKMPIAAE